MCDLFGTKKAAKAQQEAQAKMHKQQLRIQQEQAAEAKRQQELLQQQEEQRQANIRGGMSAVDNAFAQFNDDFFNTGASSYSGYYLPQIEDARKNTLAKVTANLAEKGMLESTAGANKISAIEKRAADERARIGDEAANFAQTLRSTVDQNKNQLYDLARTAADPNAVATRATGQATTLAQMPGGFTKQSIGNVFSDFLTPIAAGLTAANNSRRGLGFALAPSSGSGSAKVV